MTEGALGAVPGSAVRNREAAWNGQQLARFWDLPAVERNSLLEEAIAQSHAWHYPRNVAYRHTVAARGIGACIGAKDLPRLLRPTAQTFKSYIDVLGTLFPQDQPRAFLEWLADQLSVELPRERFDRVRSRYRSLEALLCDLEQIFSDLRLQVSTSSGTSGRATIMLHDEAGLECRTESFYLAFQRYLTRGGFERAIFVMPQQTRIAMARMAAVSVRRLGLSDDRIHFTIPFAAEPDQVRIRAGRTFRRGWQGTLEKRVWHQFMNWMQEHYVTGQAVQGAVKLLRQAEAEGEKVLLFGGWVQLHAIAQALKGAGAFLRLAAGSLLGSGGGLKELYPFTPAQIRQELARAIGLADGRPVPIRDVYGMAEGNWVAMQCAQANYHVPPWIYVRTLDRDDRFQEGADTTGLLAFFDPYDGGRLFPSFFKTADSVRLVHGGEDAKSGWRCPCGEAGDYIVHDSIQRVDLLDEAGCAAQV